MIASAVSPALSSAGPPSDCAGRTTSPFAPARLATRLDRCPPVLAAFKPSASAYTDTRWNSTRGSRGIAFSNYNRGSQLETLVQHNRTTHLDAHPRQLALRDRPPAKATQGRDDEHMERDERGRGVAGQREDGHGALGRRDRRERRGFTRLDLDAPEMDSPIEVPLDDGLEQVARAHARAARREYEVGPLEPALECSDVLVETGVGQVRRG